MNKIFSVILFLTILVFIEGGIKLDQLEKRYMGAMLVCKNKLNVSKKQIAEVEMLRVPEDRPAQCYIACLGKQLDVISENNTLWKDNILQIIEPLRVIFQGEKYDKILSILDTCDIQHDEDECTAAKGIFECIIKGIKEMGLL